MTSGYTLYLDLETFCETPITHGAHRYAEDAEVLLVAHARDDGPVKVADTSDNWGEYAPRLQRLIDGAERVVIHNSAFDRTVLHHRGVTIPVDKVVDTMVLALQHSMPGSLGMLCGVLGVPQDKAKDKDGKKLIHLFTKPLARNRKLRRATRDTHPEEWAAFIEYARLDVDAMRSVLGLLPRWNDTAGERALWHLDQRVNDRGVAVDLDLARSALRAFERTSRSLAARAGVLTGGEVGSLTQRQKLVDHLAEAHDFIVSDLTKGNVAQQLKRGGLTPEVQELLEIRQQAAATSPAKYKVLLNATSSDGRLRGTIQFCGASRTGRDAGRIFQPQNLPRPAFSAAVIETGIEAMKADCEDLLFENVSELCASAIRGCLVAPEGRKLVVADLSNIEGRVLAWLAGEEWKLKAFADFDRGVGHDLYKITAGHILGKDPSDVTKDERQVNGKVPDLACGFGGAVGAFTKMGAIYGVNLPEDEVVEIVKAWRKRHPAIVRFWYDLERACKAAIRNPGSAYEVRGIVRCDMKDGYLRIRAPGGTYLSYKDAHIDEDGDCIYCAGTGRLSDTQLCRPCQGSGRERGTGQIYYSGINQYTRKWETLETYYGKLTENLVQKVARDVFKHGLRLAEAEGYELVIPVHDEAVCETPDTDDYTAAGLSALLCKNPPWAVGLPLAAAGHEMYRYAKLD